MNAARELARELDLHRIPQHYQAEFDAYMFRAGEFYYRPNTFLFLCGWCTLFFCITMVVIALYRIVDPSLPSRPTSAICQFHDNPYCWLLTIISLLYNYCTMFVQKLLF